MLLDLFLLDLENSTVVEFYSKRTSVRGKAWRPGRGEEFSERRAGMADRLRPPLCPRLPVPGGFPAVPLARRGGHVNPSSDRDSSDRSAPALRWGWFFFLCYFLFASLLSSSCHCYLSTLPAVLQGS